VKCDKYGKLLFGSDWSLAPIKVYSEYIEALVPKKHLEDVFYGDEKRLFSKVENQ